MESVRKWIFPSMQGILIIVLAIFLVLSLRSPKDSSASFEEVQQATVASLSQDTMVLQDNMGIKRFMKMDPQIYDNIVYYKHSDPMQADELVLVKFKDDAQARDFEALVDQHIDDQNQIFEGYLPKEADKLKNAIVDVQANYALFVVLDQAKDVDENFLQSLKGA